ncbi:YihY/virulence factor BrkB family protein [Natrinema sp. 1APR25-10V2]|uniref:YihY/virulence factor BrkB family protein n=1 Tax=Natrinema sp. 1APR25-10V2 TaxID=2951081 RepID=UPI002873FEDF|nr:YihY/virulence factor BrkB family protein [Natrinema sp. 1APR25-10V2]MDS0475324.1 YihY/virulence factor BrkB family protein [Natrinema sp. 1APR25-10V2]
MDLRRAGSVARDVVAVIRDRNVTFMAGSIAHAAFLSLLPLLLVLLLVAGAVGNEYLTDQLVSLSQTYVSPAGQGLVYEALTRASDRSGASLIGLVSLLWGMFRVFRGLKTAFDELYGEGENRLREKLVDGGVVFVVILLATVGVGFATAVLASIDHPVVLALTPLVLFVGLTVAFFPVYYVFPSPDVSSREALPGTVIAAAGWVVLEAVFGIYADLVNTVGTFDTFGAIILLLIWLYATAFVLLVGAAVNVVVGDRTPDAGSAAGDEQQSTTSLRT